MNYEDMSDFEINKAVHFEMIRAGKVKERFRLNEADFVDVFRNEFGENPGPSVIAVMRYVKDGISDGYNPFGGTFDYCNNPSDAWPTIVENNISMRPMYIRDADGRKLVEWEAIHVERDFPRESFGWDDKNPLRAAMIVFLMMQEAKRG